MLQCIFITFDILIFKHFQTIILQILFFFFFCNCSCFLSLLLVAAVVWKIKQTCWASRRREVLIILRLLWYLIFQNILRALMNNHIHTFPVYFFPCIHNLNIPLNFVFAFTFHAENEENIVSSSCHKLQTLQS